MTWSRSFGNDAACGFNGLACLSAITFQGTITTHLLKHQRVEWPSLRKEINRSVNSLTLVAFA